MAGAAADAAGPLTFRVRLERLRPPPNVVAGMNILVVASLAYSMRSTLEDPPPVLVLPDGDDFFRITDGRHRFVAAMIAGRPDLLAVLDSRSM